VIESGMIQLTVLGSGSSGNCTLVETGRCRILVDAGLSTRQIVRRLESVGTPPESIRAVVVTHEHIDHTQGIAVFAKRYAVPVYCNSGTAREFKPRHPVDLRLFQTGSEFSIEDANLLPFPVPHDAADPVGFLVESGGISAGFATDLGHATHLVMDRLRLAHTVVIETNYDLQLLQQDHRRPWAVKQRIMSRHGHLSNTDASEALAELAEGSLKRAILCHLSRDCNTPALAERCTRDRLDLAAGGAASAIEVYCATQAAPTPRFAVG
jgi:phosphoribosyl 1,2-cyclic phosphodiesterase